MTSLDDYHILVFNILLSFTIRCICYAINGTCKHVRCELAVMPQLMFKIMTANNMPTYSESFQLNFCAEAYQ